MNILISGGSGLLGSRLTQLLQQKAYHVAWLSRKSNAHHEIKSFEWDPMKGKIDEEAIAWADVIIHLAGAGVADKPWTKKRKQEILDSRLQSTELLYKALKQKGKPLKAFVAASAIGYYGFTTEDGELTEESQSGNDFLAGVVRQWEAANSKIETLGIRTVKIRIGIVLSKKGGALKEMAVPVKLGAAAALGTGQQKMAWIHIDDLCRLFIHAVEQPSLSGVYNGVGPYAVSNKEFTRALAKALNRPFFLPNVPKFMMKLMIGEMADMVLYGSDVSNKKILSTGFKYQFSDLEDTLADLLKKH